MEVLRRLEGLLDMIDGVSSFGLVWLGIVLVLVLCVIEAIKVVGGSAWAKILLQASRG